MKRTALMICAAVGAFALAGCGETVPAGSVGVKVKTLWGAGTDPAPLQQGYHMLGWGEEIHSYPTRQRMYSYIRAADERGDENEEMSFNDSRGLPMTGDVQLQAATRADCVPELFNTWRLEFDSLIAGPIRLDVQAAISAETEKTTVERLYSGERQAVLAAALRPVQDKWRGFCVDIAQLAWAGPIRYPESILVAIQQKTATDQATQNAVAVVQQKKAEADAAIEEARGIAESQKLRGEALRQNPQVLQEQWIAKWNGILPTYMMGDEASVLMQLPSK